MKKIIMGVTINQLTQEKQQEIVDMVNAGTAEVKKLQSEKYGTIKYVVCH